MLLHVIILVSKRKERKKKYIYISPNAKPLHNNRFLSSRILSCITWFQHAWCAIRSFLPFTIYIYTLFTPREVPKPRISLFSLDLFSLDHQPFIFRNILPSPLPSLGCKQEGNTGARKMHRSKKNEWHRFRSLSRLRTNNYAEENKPINRDSINKTKSSPRVMNDTIEKKGERGDLSLFSRRSILPLHSRFLCEGPAIP